MRRALSRLSDEQFDLLIIGGGITGACVVRDAAMRGLKVALVEKKDFAHATSAHNSKLVHGGLRYLRNFELGLVRESLRERRIWQRIAPHLVRPLPFLLPVYGEQSREVLRAGLVLYDLLSFDKRWLDDPGERLSNHSWLPKVEALAREPVIRRQGLKGAFLYHDAQMYSPERLALECLIDADAHGAALANHVEAEKLLVRNGRVEGCSVRDVFSATSFDIRAKATLVAAGPWADIFLEKSLRTASSTHLLRSKGIHLLTRAVTRDCALTMAVDGGHFFVMPWRGRSLIGTTDTVYRGDPDTVGVGPTDLGDFLSFVDRHLPAAQLGPRDVENFYVGIRPLVDDGSGDSYHTSRRAELIDHAKKDRVLGLYSAVGGKWTTSRALAQTVTDKITAALNKAGNACRTAVTPLPGGGVGRWDDFTREVETHHPQLPSRQHLSHMYGIRLKDVLAQAQKADLQPMGYSDDIPAQIRFAAREEMAMTLADAVMRRTSLGQFGRPPKDALEIAAAIMADELGWNSERKSREVASIAPLFELRDTP